METKPFNLQSPEQIAKDYGGNKQKIAQAASMGMVDPTAAVLAGMFIDRMRSAQMQEQQPQGTVAQQVFQPQQAPQGAPPQGAPPPMGAPPMGAPPPPQPPGMAMGGLMDLSVPDDMFEEPVTDAENFAGGGLVAFAMGGEADEEEYDPNRVGVAGTPAGRMLSATASFFAGLPERERARRAREWRRGVDMAYGGKPPSRPRADVTAAPTPVTAAPRPAATAATPQAMPAAATAAPTSPRAPMAAPTAPRGLGALAAPQGTAPRPAAAAAAAPGAPTAPGTPPAPQAPAGPTGLQGGIEEYMRLMGPQAPTPERDKFAAMMAQQMSPEAMAAQKKQDMWQALAQFGFGMAGTNSPSFMQAAGQAGAATVPAMAAMAKERKATEREARKWLVDNENMTNAEGRALRAQGLTFSQAREAVEENRRQFDANFGLEEEKFKYTKQRDIAERADRRRGSGGGGLGAPDFPGGEYGYKVKLFYDREMAKIPLLLAKNPGIKADQAWMARYSQDAQRRAVEYVDAQRGGGGATQYDRRTGQAPATSSGGRPPLSSFGG
jgi:hypothetical protein